MSQKLSKREALNEVAKVLEAALAEYESLEKMDFEGEESEEEKAEREAAAQAEAAQSQEAPAEESQEAPADEQSPEESQEAPADEAAMASEEEEDEDEELNDETLKSEYAKLTKKMASRGLIKTEMKKSETATDLKKYETQVADLSKTVTELQATIKKIANTPVSKGVKGYNPLKKNTEEDAAKPLNKAEVISTILDLKKSGKSVPQGIVNRIEGNRLSEQDVNYIKGIVG